MAKYKTQFEATLSKVVHKSTLSVSNQSLSEQYASKYYEYMCYISLYCQTVNNTQYQKDIVGMEDWYNDFVSDFSEMQKHTLKWMHTTIPDIKLFLTLSKVEKKLFSRQLELLSKLSDSYLEGTEEDTARFRKNLTSLISSVNEIIKKERDSIFSIIQQMSTFLQESIHDIDLVVNTEKVAVEKNVIAQKELDDLDNEIKDLQKTIANLDISEKSFAVAGGIPFGIGGVMIAFNQINKLCKGLLIFSVVAEATAGALAIAKAVEESKLVDKLQEKEQKKIICAAISLVENSLNDIQKNSTSLLEYLQALIDIWNEMDKFTEDSKIDINEDAFCNKNNLKLFKDSIIELKSDGLKLFDLKGILESIEIPTEVVIKPINL